MMSISLAPGEANLFGSRLMRGRLDVAGGLTHFDQNVH